MNFNSLVFATFLTIVFISYWIMPYKHRWLLLLGASYYFYASWNTKYVILIFFITLLSYIAAILLENECGVRKKKVILTGTIILCLSLLFFFKYFNFLSNTMVNIFRVFSLQIHPVILNILVPVGISFYTFQAMSYVIDVYKGGGVQAEYHFGVYAAFISFFPQLVAGPIERTKDLLPQIKTEKNFEYEKAAYGIKLMAWGYFKKVAIADVLAPYVENVFSAPRDHIGIDLMIAAIFFSIQIYCDFSGYSDIAIGTAKLLGIDLTTNFRSPYFSKSVKEFWSRWHISLSTWFRDYIYIPLGGNRVSLIRHSMNLFMTFLISGLWHGANWTFFVWGGCHGAIRVIENIFGNKIKKYGERRLAKVIMTIVTFCLCCLLWIFFRSESISDALYIIYHIFFDFRSTLGYSSRLNLFSRDLIVLYFNVAVLLVYDFFSLKHDVIMWVSKQKIMLRWSIYLILIWLIIIGLPISNAEFIYFQF